MNRLWLSIFRYIKGLTAKSAIWLVVERVDKLKLKNVNLHFYTFALYCNIYDQKRRELKFML